MKKVVNKQFKVLVDINKIPDGLDPASFVKLVDSGYVFYDSKKEGDVPVVIETGTLDKLTPVQFVDCGEEVEYNALAAKWEYQDKWDKELFKCKASPIHYYTNYVSNSPSATQEEITEYLESIGISEKEEDLEKLKEARTKFAEGISMEYIQTRAAVREGIVEKYIQQIGEIAKGYCEENGIEYKSYNSEKLLEKLYTTLCKVPPIMATPKLEKFLVKKSKKYDKKLMKHTSAEYMWEVYKEYKEADGN